MFVGDSPDRTELFVRLDLSIITLIRISCGLSFTNAEILDDLTSKLAQFEIEPSNRLVSVAN